MSRKMRLLAVALVLTLGAAGAASAFPLAPRPAAAGERSGLIDRLLELASRILPPGLSSIWDNEGSQMDPDGQPH